MMRRVLLAVLCSCFSSCGQGERQPLVVLIGLDGGSLDIVDELRAEERLPNFERLMASGTSGPLQSWPSRRVMRESSRRYFASPIVWASIATGKVPEKHGIRDFVLPIPGTASVWMGSEDDPARAAIRIPQIEGRAPFVLRLKLHSYEPNGEQGVDVIWNGERLETLRVPVEWTEFSVPVAAADLRSGQNRLELLFARQSRPSEAGDSSDRRRLAGELAFVSVIDGKGKEIVSLSPAVSREHFERGFYEPRGRLAEIQSVHWRAKPVWMLLGDAGVSVGIVGYWGTWPAYEVNGFLVSSRMGIRDQRSGSGRLTWPEDLARELEPLAPLAEDLAPTLEQLHVSECEPPFIDRSSVLKKILIQDTYYVRLAKQLLPRMDSGLFTIYLRSLDVAGHVTLHWRAGAPLPANCPDSLRDVMDETYVKVDAWIGEILDALPRGATVIVVSDHGMQPIEGAGHHAPFGLFIANGENIRRGRSFHGSTVLDVAPTLLHAFAQPVPLDMDGNVLAALFEEDWLRSNPLRFTDVDTSMSLEGGETTEASEEVLEELRALGYIE
ncbi:MAG TPA: alkaline phosphatase family protein [Vicinamibacteria bacterium]|nr:alkaline phosphatase family protein [Vicinamibacteria bacterium]